MNSYRPIFFILVFFIASAAGGQQSTPPKPTGDAQPLTVAMGVIQKELNDVGKLTFTVQVSNADEKASSSISEQLSNVVADPATCTIHYHFWKMMHGNVENDDDVSLNLNKMQGVWTMSAEQYFKKVEAKEGPSPDGDRGYYMKFDPAMYVVVMRISDDNEEGLPFTDEKQAARVGNAVTQAVQLCGGKLGAY
jgi:hypothetical protein